MRALSPHSEKALKERTMDQINGINELKGGALPQKTAFVSPKTLSEYLDIPESTIRTWIHLKSIPFKKVGFLVRFELSEIHAWIQANNEKLPKKHL